jgi:hypothetical protein
MNGISMAITKTLYFVMATPLLLMSSMLTAQMHTSGAPKTGGAILAAWLRPAIGDS